MRGMQSDVTTPRQPSISAQDPWTQRKTPTPHSLWPSLTGQPHSHSSIAVNGAPGDVQQEGPEPNLSPCPASQGSCALFCLGLVLHEAPQASCSLGLLSQSESGLRPSGEALHTLYVLPLAPFSREKKHVVYTAAQ